MKPTTLKTVLLVLALLFIAGCAATPSGRWTQAATVMTATNNSVADLHAVGVVSDERLLEMRPYLEQANAALERAHARLPEGGTAFEYVMDAFDAAILAVQQELAKER